MTRNPLSAFTARGLGLALTLALTAGAAHAEDAAAAAEPLRLGREVAPIFQAVHLTFDPDQADYRGTIRAEVEVHEPTASFRLHSLGPAIERVTLTGDDGEVPVQHAAAGEDQLRITATAPLVPGRYVLELAFTNPFDTQAIGLYRMEQGGEGYAFTQFEADDAREAFPCWDEPAYKIPYQITLTVPEGDMALSNTPPVSETVRDGWRTTVFARTPPLPSYLLALAAGPLETVPIPGLGVPGRIVTVRGQSHLTQIAAGYTPPLMTALERYFDRPYPYRKLDFIAIPEYWAGAMENPGAVTWADRLLLLEPATATLDERRTLARVIAHELAHQWFGNLVTMEWWDDLWLNESFADWLGDKVTHELYPDYDLALSTAQSAQGIMTSDARTTTEPIRQPEVAPNQLLANIGLAYHKGKTVLGMFEQWLGPEVFRRGVLDYVAANAWGNAAASDLWQALDRASGTKVSTAMATFIELPGIPRVDVEWLGEGRLLLEQERFRTYGATSEDHQWQVPLILKYPQGDGVATQRVLLREERAEVRVDTTDAPAWIHPNAGAYGYYRWTVPPAQLRSLAAHATEVLTPRERIEVIGNVSALLDAGALAGGEYLELLRELADDPEPLVVRSVINALADVEAAFVPPELEEAFAAYVRAALAPALARFGRDQRADEPANVALVRPSLYGWLADEGRDAELRRHARQLAESFLADPTSIDPALVTVSLRILASDGDRALFDELRRRFEAAPTPGLRDHYLLALGGFTDPEVRAAALRYLFEGAVRPNETFAIAGGIMRDDAGRDQVFDFITGNYEAFAARFPPPFLAFMPSLATGCSRERLAAAERFFGQPEHRVDGTERSLERVGEQVRECIALREREGASVAEYLRGVAAAEPAG